MSKVAISEEYLTDIADSIREKLDTSDTYKVSEMSEAIDSITTGGGFDIKDYFYESTSINNAGKLIKKFPSFQITSTSLSQFFYVCSELLEISPIDTKDVTDFSYMVNGCSKLTTIPVFDLSSATNIQNMFGTSSNSLSDESLNNIMLSCIGINPEYSGTKSLQYIGLWSNSRNKCKDLPAYQDFLNAGWTTGD